MTLLGFRAHSNEGNEAFRQCVHLWPLGGDKKSSIEIVQYILLKLKHIMLTLKQRMHYKFDTGLGFNLSVMPNVDFVVGEAMLVMRDSFLAMLKVSFVIVRRQQFLYMTTPPIPMGQF